MATAAKMIKVEQIGSAIRRHHSQRATLIGMKLNKIGRVSELEDTPSVRGMIARFNTSSAWSRISKLTSPPGSRRSAVPGDNRRSFEARISGFRAAVR